MIVKHPQLFRKKKGKSAADRMCVKIEKGQKKTHQKVGWGAEATVAAVAPSAGGIDQVPP